MMKTPFAMLKVKTRMAIVSLACVALFDGCSFAPNYTKPSVPTPAAFKELTPSQFNAVDGWKTAAPGDEQIRGQWWEVFQEPELDAFENQVTVSNQSVAAALANFLAARAVVKQARSQYFPTVSANPSVISTRQSSAADPGTAVTSTEYALPFDASWEPDFWGRIRNTVRANSLEAQATLADFQNVRLTIQAEVAVDYFELRVLDAQKQLLETVRTSHRPKRNLKSRARRPPTSAFSAPNSNTPSRCSLGSRPPHSPSPPIRWPQNPWPSPLAFHRNCSNAVRTSPPPNAGLQRRTHKSAWRARLIIQPLP
jgi:hypothetical protein